MRDKQKCDSGKAILSRREVLTHAAGVIVAGLAAAHTGKPVQAAVPRRRTRTGKPRRFMRVAAGQIGPILEGAKKEETVDRLIDLLEEAARLDVDLVNFPECALSTFFPRLVMSLDEAKEKYFEKTMPNPSVQALFDRAKELKIGFNLGYAELDGDNHYNTTILVAKDGRIIGKYRKTHIPGSVNPPRKGWPHLEKRYFLPGDTGFKVWKAFNSYVVI